ncbi:MAG: hypothetical protein L0Z48_06200, partial [candidate division Zixibacteria bacterium]|nr:hypothetical protein [candidate division Zixibacteria bacterium]
KNFERALELDSTLFDAYNGLGNYNFWKSAKTRKFLISAFFPDERKMGVEQLILAKEQGYFSRSAAAASLLWALINQKEYRWAQKLADSLSAAYPQAKSPLWALGTIYQEKEMWDSAAAVFSELLRRLETDSLQTGFNLVECRARLAAAYFNAGRHQDALLESEAARGYQLSRKNRKRLKGQLENLAEISKKSRKALAQTEPD